MARRKTKRVQVKKVGRGRLETAFSCPFCNEEGSVECKLYVCRWWCVAQARQGQIETGGIGAVSSVRGGLPDCR